MTLSGCNTIQPGDEPIPGYKLEEPIGRGGFGEVWRADAPGGIKKAVKFVFGATDQTRGSRELKSLERIKGVHHPFLLTLERFGIVNDQLVIVTELADGSLEEVYSRHRERGSCGIPRAALLSYMHDAADALDYLHDRYRLQHLDVKPGNLLLVGGHVKVGDFGLLKDLRDVECSVVGGLTPTYAPPEVFDGQPSMHSDQYSLAVMYQELLTGTRPFTGRTIAQLATQHVHNAPNLEPLPPADRPFVARALEKNAERRFSSCKEFVDALRSTGDRNAGAVSRSGVNGSSTQPAWDSTSGEPASPRVEELPSLVDSTSMSQPRISGHALVIALGGTGAECLRELRSRVAKLHSACPVGLHAVLIDTDLETVHAAKLAETSGRVPHCQSVHVPLRSAQEYRSLGTDRLGTISRRWIYNVPRSRATEGMRPLGRLALVDGADAVTKAIRDSVEHLAVVSGERTPCVYVVGSISGGTASGMVYDVAHLLRHALDEAGLERATILSLLTSTALQGNPTQPLALHDAEAALVEMNHFLQPGNGYPGDPGAGWPSVPAARTPLRGAYVVAAGNAGTYGADPVETVVEYLWADAAGAASLLAKARQVETGDTGGARETPAVRSVGVVRLRCVRTLEENLLAPAAVRHLLIRWLGRPGEARELATPLAERLARRCGVASDPFIESSLQQVAPEADERRAKLVTTLRSLDSERLNRPAELERFLSAELNAVVKAPHPDKLVTSILTGLTRELSARLHDRRVDVTTAMEAVGLLGSRARELSRELLERRTPDHSGSDGEAASANREAGDRTRQLEIACDDGERVLLRLATRVAAYRLEMLGEQLDEFRERLESVAARLAQAIQLSSQQRPAEENPWAEMPAAINAQFEPTLARLHLSVASSWLSRSVGEPLPAGDPREMVIAITKTALPLVEQVIDEAGEFRSEDDRRPHRQRFEASTTTAANAALSSTVTLSARETKASAGTQSLHAARSFSADVRDDPGSIETALDAVRPPLLQCGGRDRLILLVGSEAERAALEPKVRAAHHGALTVATVPGVAPMLIHEAQQIRIADVLSRLRVVSGGNTQISSRLQSRTDIDWSDIARSDTAAFKEQ